MSEGEKRYFFSLPNLQAAKILAVFGFYGWIVNIIHFIQLWAKEGFGGLMPLFLASDMIWNNSNVLLLIGSLKKKIKFLKIYFAVASISCILHVVSAVFIGKYCFNEFFNHVLTFMYDLRFVWN